MPLSPRETPGEALADGAAAPLAPATLEDALRALADQADIVFTGEVCSIERTAGTVAISWQVEHAVRGAAAGQVYVLREWAGLWQAQGARYSKGQRALLLLHAPSAAGYASPVGGQDGVIALQGDADDGTLDLRLLQQRVLVTDAARLRPAAALKAAGGSLALSDALQREYAARQPKAAARASGDLQSVAHSSVQVRISPEPEGGATTVVTGTHGGPSNVSTATDPNSRVDAGMVVSLLKAWQLRGAAQ